MKAKHFLFATLLLTVSMTGSLAQTVFQDNFRSALSPSWSIVRQDTNYYSLSSTGLVLRCNSGDLYESANNAKNVFLITNPVTGDFVITAHLRWLVPPSTSYAQFALLAYDDDDNYVRGYYGDIGTNEFVLATETLANYVSGPALSLDIGTNQVWLQLTKQNFNYSVAYSLDGTNFISLGAAMAFSEGVPQKLGFVAMVDPTETATALIDSFTMQSIPFAEPGGGLAAYQTVNLAPVANAVNARLMGVPVGLVSLGGVPFNLLPQSGNNSWDALVGTTVGVQSTNTMQLPVQLYGLQALDLLINTSWGNPGSTSIFLTLMCSDGSAYTNSFVEGVDTRDWLESAYDNTVTSPNTTQVFSAVPVPGYSNPWGRIDKQHLVLPARFAGLEVTNLVLTDTGVTGNTDNTYSLSVHAQRAFLYGITATVTWPVISIANHTNSVWLSWPTNAAGFSLQATTNLSNPNWMIFPGIPMVQGNQFWITTTITNKIQYFRLAQPL